MTEKRKITICLNEFPPKSSSAYSRSSSETFANLEELLVNLLLLYTEIRMSPGHFALEFYWRLPDQARLT